MKEERIKLAIQKKGRLNEAAIELLRECGVSLKNGGDKLMTSSESFPIDVLFLRNSDIPKYVSDGVAHLGICGENVVAEKGLDVDSLVKLGFGNCRLSMAVPINTDHSKIQDLEGKRIATSYPNSLRAFLDQRKIQADIHEISGSVEIAPGLGLAEGICDLVSTGSTLFKNGLKEVELVMNSEACLFANPTFAQLNSTTLQDLLVRLQSVLASRNNKYVLLNAPDEALEAICSLLPGMKSPTIMPLAKPGWNSVHSVIKESDFWEVIDQLKLLGAEGILVVPIQKMIA